MVMGSEKNQEFFLQFRHQVTFQHYGHFRYLQVLYSNNTTFTKYCLTQWISKLLRELWNPLSKAVPGQFHGSGRHSKCNCLQDSQFSQISCRANCTNFYTGVCILQIVTGVCFNFLSVMDNSLSADNALRLWVIGPGTCFTNVFFHRNSNSMQILLCFHLACNEKIATNILCVTWQLYCRGMCKNLLRSHVWVIELQQGEFFIRFVINYIVSKNR